MNQPTTQLRLQQQINKIDENKPRSHTSSARLFANIFPAHFQLVILSPRDQVIKQSTFKASITDVFD